MKRSRRRNLVVILAGATMSATLALAPTRSAAQDQRVAAQPSDAPSAEPSVTAEEAAGRETQQLINTLSDPAAPQPQRDEAALRLLARGAESKPILLAALVDQNAGGQIAVARALGGDRSGNAPDPAYINALFAAFGSQRQLTEDVATALSKYRNNSTVLTRLIDSANSRRATGGESTRVAAIKALGAFPEKRSAETLVRLLRDPEESVGVRNKAADALATLSAISGYGEDPQQWERWWQDHASRSEADFHAEIVERKAAQVDTISADKDRLATALQDAVREQYQLAPDAPRKEQALLKFLKSSNAEIRETAAKLAFEDFQTGTVPPAAIEQLRMMIGDSSASVRRAVIETLGKMNDRPSVDPFIAQLARESDPAMRVQMARALGLMLQPRAVPTLIGLLNDNSAMVARTAAGSLRYLADNKVILPDSPEANELSKTLYAIIARSGDASNGSSSSSDSDLRVSAIEALVPLKRAEYVGPLYLRLLNPRTESPRVRRLALAALGRLGDANTIDAIINVLSNDPDDTVREEAIKALKFVSPSPAQIELLKPFLERTAAGNGSRDPSLGEAAWDVLQASLPSLSKEQLTQWADRFNGDPIKQILVRERLAEVLATQDQVDELADVKTQIGDNHMSLQPPDPEKAAALYKEALALRQRGGAQPRGAVMENLVTSNMNALLNTTRYADAITFAVETSRADSTRWQLMGSMIVNQVDQLKTLDTIDSLRQAIQLLDAATKVKTDLPERYRSSLDTLRKEVDKRIAELSRPRGSYLPMQSLPFEPWARRNEVVDC